MTVATAKRALAGGLLVLATPVAAAAQPGQAVIELQQQQLEVPLAARLTSLLGLVAILALAWALSSHRRRIPWRVVAWGLGLQFALGLLMLRTGVGRGFFGGVKNVINGLLGFYKEGARLLFGPLMDAGRHVHPDVLYGFTAPDGTMQFLENPQVLDGGFGVVFALTVLPTIIFFSSLISVLYHLGVMQRVVNAIARVVQKTMGTSGAESLSVAGNIFVGQTEAPLLIKPYVDRMTRSELMAVMVGGFATVAGGVMAAYVGMFGRIFPDMAGHLLTASIMSAPAALVVAKLMEPETGTPETIGRQAQTFGADTTNVIDAAAGGAADGLKLAANIAAMLLAFVALVALLNFLLGWAGGLVGIEGLTFERILGWVLAPLAWLMGVPWEDATEVGSLLGIKSVLNEFYAYDVLARALAGGELHSARSVVIATYALCGFANFSSIAIQIGGIGAIAPGRRSDLARLGLRAMIGGNLAAFMTATVAGIVL